MQKLGIWSWHGYTIPNIKTGATYHDVGFGLDLDLGERISVVVIMACLSLRLFKLDASVDAAVEKGSSAEHKVT
jgi:hypothetical protein